jgi:hypothetical protein
MVLVASVYNNNNNLIYILVGAEWYKLIVLVIHCRMNKTECLRTTPSGRKETRQEQRKTPLIVAGCNTKMSIR